LRPPAFASRGRWLRGNLHTHSDRSDVAIGEALTDAAFDLDKLRSPYWRLTVTDADGRRAWTNPVWI
jgi:hypothetical protein